MNWLDLGVKALAIIGGFIAVLTFWRTAKVRRAEWLSSLHAKFFEAASYKRIRRILDSDAADSELAKLRAEIANNQNSDTVEELVDFLNFFEFVASLRNLGQIRESEIRILFDYYLRLLCTHDFVRAYLRENGFEQLDQYLRKCVERDSK